MGQPGALVQKRFVAGEASVGLHHDVAAGVFLEVGLGSENTTAQIAGQLRWRFSGYLRVFVLVFSDHVRLEARHGLKGLQANVAVVTLPLVDSLDVQLQTVLERIRRAAFFAGELGLFAGMCQTLVPLNVKMAIGLVGAVWACEHRRRCRSFAILSTGDLFQQRICAGSPQVLK